MIVEWTFCTSIIRKPRNNFYHKVLWMDNLEGGKTFKKKKKPEKSYVTLQPCKECLS